MSKVMALSEAIARYVYDGDTIYAAGFTHLIPFAAGHEIIRQGRKDLVLARATPDLLYDQMVAAGCAAQGDLFVHGQPWGWLAAHRAVSDRGRQPGMGGVFSFWDDLSAASRRDRAALHADESDRGGRPGAGKPKPPHGH